jgi:nitrite reductase/ring-hydroxylating ferredoxin subunit
MRVLICGLFLIVPGIAAADDFKPEDGFTLLFDKDLTGWKEKNGGASLDGKSEAYKGRFTLKDGVLTIDPKVKGDVRIMTAREFSGDVHIKFDYKPGKGCNNDLFIRGSKFDIKTPDIKNLKQDEWNQFEIIIKGDKIEYLNNGESQRKNSVKPAATVFEVRAEFGPVEFRRMRVMGGTK